MSGHKPTGFDVAARWRFGPERTLPPLRAISRTCGFWHRPAVIAKNNFKGKSLSNWAINFSVGCTHACRFCYVPSTSTNKLVHQLANLGVRNPDEEWGQYAFVRPWDEKAFLTSLAKAQATRKSELKADGNRAVMLCSTTDAYQLFRHPDPITQKKLNESARWAVRRSLELIRDHSDLRVRVLTRSPLAQHDFDLYRSFGNRLMFGMSLPTLNDAVLRIYEPGAPGARARLAALTKAAEEGLNVFVAMAPTPPECDRGDYRRTLVELKKLGAATIFHEPINIRAENIARIEQHAAALGVTIRSDVLRDRAAWSLCAIQSLWAVAEEAHQLGLGEVLHPWPDQALQSPVALKALEPDERVRWLRFFNDSWSRVSAWPGDTTALIPLFPHANAAPMKDKLTKKPGPKVKDTAAVQSALKLLRPIRDVAEYLAIPCEQLLSKVKAEDANAIDITSVDAPRWTARLILAGETPVVESPIDGISGKGSFQYRDEVTARIVEEYTELYAKGEPVPPIVLWQNPSANELLIIDGFHRVRACAKSGRDRIPAVIVRCPCEIAAILPVRLNEVHGLKYGQSEKRRALQALFRAEPKLAKELRANRKGKSVTTEAIGALYGAAKATVSRALDDADDQQKLELTSEPKIDYLEYDLSVILLQGKMQYLKRESSLPVSSGHIRELARLHAGLENLLCRLLDVDVRSLRKKLQAVTSQKQTASTD